jgi:apolipoprotein D and lipocalin family protein
MIRVFTRAVPALALLALCSCSAGKPVTAPTVREVDLARYMGTWYEIARLPHGFEKGLKCVSATYSLRPDGKVSVTNRGVREADGAVKSVEGVALVPDPGAPGKLRVSFFRPFYGDYWILVLDPDYRHALVSGSTDGYLWILAREASIDVKAYESLVALARDLGFDTSRLIKVAHNCR